MKISFTKKQFRDLLELLYLGNWLANATRVGTQEDQKIQKFDDIEQYVFSFAKEFESQDLVERQTDDQEIFPTRKLEEGAEKYIEHYNEDTFWEELFHRMYARDFERVYPEDVVEKLDMLELFEKEEPFRQKWGDELEAYGIDRLEIISDDKKAIGEMVEAKDYKLSPEGIFGDTTLVESVAGSKNGLLRYYAVLSCEDNRSLTKGERERLQNVLNSLKMEYKGEVEIEKAEYEKEFVLVTMLVGFEHAMGTILDNLIIATNGMKPFLRFHYYVTNTHKPSHKEILNEYLKKL